MCCEDFMKCLSLTMILFLLSSIVGCSSSGGQTVTVTTSENVEIEKGNDSLVIENTETDTFSDAEQSKTFSEEESSKKEQSEKVYESSSILSEGSNQSTNKPTETIVKYSDKNVEYIGRFSFSDNLCSFGWSGCRITAGFKGSKIGVTLKSNSSEDYINVYIDGVREKKLKITSKKELYILAEGLSNEKHTVELEKCTEGSQTTITFYGFDYFDGSAYFAPAKKEKTIMFIGDSVTAGYGVLGTENGFRLSEENIALTYAGYTAKMLNANGIYLAVSGQGVAQTINGNSNTVMIDYLCSTIPQNGKNDFDIKQENPDFIVVNLGTNDFASGVSIDKFKTKYFEMISALRNNYPNAYIVCMAGPHKVGLLAANYIKEIVEDQKKSGDNKIDFVSVSAADGMGSDGHPTESEQKIAGAELLSFLKKKLK